MTHDGVGGGLTVSGYAASLERSWDKEVTQFGWAAPPVFAAAPAPGGRYHVRIDNLSPGLYGFVSPVGDHAGFVGNNPSTAWNDGDAYASCMVLNVDYSGFPSSPQAALDSTTAHEFNHSIQFGYGALAGTNVPDDVFVEGGATWMEDEVHDAADDNYNYLWPVFADSMGDYDASPYPYWITFRGFSERYGSGGAGGGEQVMQDFWELTSQNAASNQAALATALAARGTTLADAFHAYAVAVRFNRPCGGGYAYPYCFEEAAGYVSAAGATPVQASIGSVGASATGSVEDNYALAWVALPASSGAYNVTLANTSGGGQLRGTAVCDTGSGLSLSPLSAVVASGGSSTLVGFNPAGCSSRVLVVTNQSQTAANPTTSTSRSFSVSTAGAPPTTHTLSVTKTGSGSGTVTSSPAGINCGGDCSHSYNEGTSVTLTATPAAGSSFAGWSDACSGTGACTVTMSTSRPVTAAFALVPDETPPQTTITGGPSGDTTDSTPTFQFESSEAGSAFTCQIDGGAAVACSSPYTTGTLAQGPHTFSVAATDAAGNTDPTPATRSFTVVDAPPPDEDPPDTTITAGPFGDTSDTTPSFSFSSDEAESTFVCQVDAALPQACTSPYATASLALGPHSFSVYATDQAGNPDPTPAARQFRVVSARRFGGQPEHAAGDSGHARSARAADARQRRACDLPASTVAGDVPRRSVGSGAVRPRRHTCFDHAIRGRRSDVPRATIPRRPVGRRPMRPPHRPQPAPAPLHPPRGAARTHRPRVAGGLEPTALPRTPRGTHAAARPLRPFGARARRGREPLCPTSRDLRHPAVVRHFRAPARLSAAATDHAPAPRATLRPSTAQGQLVHGRTSVAVAPSDGLVATCGLRDKR